jgi:hypothetical protein
MTQYKYFEEKEMRRTSIYKDIPCNFVEVNRINRRKILNVDTGEIFDTLQLAADSIGKSHESIAAACQKRIKTAGGYRWEYIGDAKNRIRCIGPETIYDTIVDAARDIVKKQGVSLNAAKYRISRCIYGNLEKAYGYRWERVK